MTHRLEGVPRLGLGGVVAFLRGVGGLRASALTVAAVVAAATSRLALMVELGMVLERKGRAGRGVEGKRLCVVLWMVVVRGMCVCGLMHSLVAWLVG